MSRKTFWLALLVVGSVMAVYMSVRSAPAACGGNCVEHDCYFAVTYWRVISGECRRTWHDTVQNGTVMSTTTWAEPVERVTPGRHDCLQVLGAPAYATGCGVATGLTGTITCCSSCNYQHGG